MAYLNLDLSSYDLMDSPLPAGQYVVVIKNSEVVQTKTGRSMLKLTFIVADGQYSNRVIFENFVLGEPIAMSRLKTLATVIGHSHPDSLADSQELHGGKCIVNVVVKNDEVYGIQNSIKSFKKDESNKPIVQATQTQQAPVFNPAPAFTPQPCPTPPPSFNASAPTNDDDDDLPF